MDGAPQNFGVSGLLFDNNLILFDRRTDSLWSQMRLESICGALSGTKPPLLPVVQSTWAAWKALYPETTVVSFNTGFSRNYDVYPYGDYDQLDSTQLLFPQTTIDPRLPMKENVLGIRPRRGRTRLFDDTYAGAWASARDQRRRERPARARRLSRRLALGHFRSIEEWA